MSYSNIFLRRNSLRIPTVIFLVVISFVVFLLTRIFSPKPIASRASKKVLKRVAVVNLSHNQAGVFWQTEQKETGWLVYSDKQNVLDQIAFDEKDIAEKKSSYLNHYALLKNLKPDHSYFFKIISGKEAISDTNNKAFVLRTLFNINNSVNISPAYGKVVVGSGIPLSSGVVTLSFKDSFPLLALLKISGEWLIPLNNIVDQNSLKLRTLETNEIGSLEIYSEDGGKTSVEAIPKNLSPLPQTVIMGQNYSFTSNNDILSASDTQLKPNTIAIIFPKEEAVIPAENPLIKGMAIPGSEITVIINSEVVYSTRVKVDKDGIWRVVLKNRLPPGRHSLTVIAKDELGQEMKLTRQFIIAKSGEQVLGEATAEPTLTGEPTPTVISESWTPTPTIYKTGFNPIPVTVISGSLVIIGLGIILAF
ncbi:hypothetical protein COS31_02060 [Candidatus Roizmanbacteria bacterium CG02_land_8_20_14_3_00_36_15]|uniref:Uncharacterized protein n=2 Tax=Candidatus Roizmaniibacteriota TaxID=1752723 RepID=A0A2M8KLW8_9BACT|nr:MAG: hypothetical protein COS51_03295 [Candidatus Roizmanbacteria bacterium CG03_land_8_20_14_0_80_36_21]PIV37849.1 MAG: hypothetical protein COS31_02060 [Candidatus Roizmanbacteria bacterium CG02_land_8_20_14_3_00_36_15]PIY70192.1 MAG: hypothetical protein COY89_02510 [Candidatus Roizmanbacteria bacterium CG_4_10_14_0_8_um_filter_36_36]PJA53415.1 MAG: hypothetical protein CO166_01925 [Candidatus Roizmanbacteria bacterium CG_4_9_14_3_um_filter_36_11]PJC81348.1 MAG: hypothetical protein CO007